MSKRSPKRPRRLTPREREARWLIRGCCYSYPGHRLTPAEISVLTRIPVAHVEKDLEQLREKNRLPIQYLDHLLN